MDKAQDLPPSALVDLPELLDRLDNDRELLRDLLGIFKDEFPRHLRALQEAVARQDLKETLVASHTMKGMLSNLAVTRAAAAAGQLEQLAHDGAPADLVAALATFELEVRGLLPEMEMYTAEVGD